MSIGYPNVDFSMGKKTITRKDPVDEKDFGKKKLDVWNVKNYYNVLFLLLSWYMYIHTISVSVHAFAGWSQLVE